MKHKTPKKFTPAIAKTIYHDILDKTGSLCPTLTFMYVYNNIYLDLADKAPIKQTRVAGIEAIFILLGESDLTC